MELEKSKLGYQYYFLMQEIGVVKSLEKLYSIYNNFADKNHPAFYHIMGTALISNFQKEKEGRNLLIKGALMGIRFSERDWNVPFVDAIGSCLGILLLNTKINFSSSALKIFSLTYVYLSAVIKSMPKDAHDSYSMRAHLIIRCNILAGEFVRNYLSGSAFPQILALADNFMAARAFYIHNYESDAEECIRQAQKIHDWFGDITIGGKDGNEYSLEEIAALGGRRHDRIYGEVFPLVKQHKLDISEAELRSLFENG